MVSDTILYIFDHICALIPFGFIYHVRTFTPMYNHRKYQFDLECLYLNPMLIIDTHTVTNTTHRSKHWCEP